MFQRTIQYIIVLSFFSAASLGFAEESAMRSYSLPAHGSLRLQVPQSWQDELKQIKDLPPTIVFSPQRDPAFQVMVTAIFPPRADMALPTEKDVKEIVEKAAATAESQAVEGKLVVRELRGASAAGYYFAATDRAPKNGEYKYLTQGILRVGGCLLSFSVLTNDGSENVAPAALLMLQNSAHLAAAQ